MAKSEGAVALGVVRGLARANQTGMVFAVTLLALLSFAGGGAMVFYPLLMLASNKLSAEALAIGVLGAAAMTVGSFLILAVCISCLASVIVSRECADKRAPDPGAPTDGQL